MTKSGTGFSTPVMLQALATPLRFQWFELGRRGEGTERGEPVALSCAVLTKRAWKKNRLNSCPIGLKTKKRLDAKLREPQWRRLRSGWYSSVCPSMSSALPRMTSMRLPDLTGRKDLDVWASSQKLRAQSAGSRTPTSPLLSPLPQPVPPTAPFTAGALRASIRST
jgi:hypothetical protein